MSVEPIVPHHRQHATCPTCREPVAGLLAGCGKPLCRRVDIAFDAALDRRLDR
ncbi:hypothetical protein ABZY58_12090 [Micromonospora tulbaghiae]|uniref:hypothetical protein n=1 Tax=Micromonospora tulbaghiae TaxID=479978 RepID=UPI0033B1F7EE